MPQKKATSNPFQPAAGARPPELVGREAELASIEDATARLSEGSAPVVMAIVGLRGLGKTALLSELESRLERMRAIVVRVEVERESSLASLVASKIRRVRRENERLPKRLAGLLDTALARVPSLSFELPEHLGSVSVKTSGKEDEDEEGRGPIGEVVSLFNEAVTNDGRHLAILIDEIQDADLTSLGAIAAAVHRSASTTAPILLAVAGLPQAETLFKRIRTYTQRWDHLHLDFLTRAEVVMAIRVPIERRDVTIDDDALRSLVAECAGYPYFVQAFASAAWSSRSGSRISLDDVERAIPPVRAKIERVFYRDVLDRLTTRELVVVIALADLGGGPQALAALAERLGVGSERLGSIRANLIKKDIIISPGPRLLEFRIPLLDRYVREHRVELDDANVRRYREAFGTPNAAT